LRTNATQTFERGKSMIDMPGKLPLPDWLTKSGDSSVGLYQTRTNKSRLTDFGNEPTVGAERIITLTKAALPLSTSRRLAIQADTTVALRPST
jgi:hypothetical protein